VLLFLMLRHGLGAQAANAVSLLVTAVANTAVNRRLTFGIAGRQHAIRHQLRGLIAFGAGLALTSAALAGLDLVAPGSGRAAELSVLLTAALAATLLRFGLYRSWVFRGSAA
jgi:putative flippase GtrA